MEARRALVEDARLLAELNRQLIEDEGSANPMRLNELEARMCAWLRAEYSALLFSVADATVAYALLRPSEGGTYLRQFFVDRAHRRKGYGRRAVEIIRERFVAPGTHLELEVLVHNRSALAFWRACGLQDHAISLRL